MKFLDCMLSSFKAWRRRQKGVWYLVRHNMHPATEVWSRTPPSDEVWESLIEKETY